MKLKSCCVILLAALSSCQSNGQQKTKAKTAAVQSTGASEIIQQIPEKLYPGLAPASIAPDATKIDAEEILAIVNGTCIVRKGKLQALIDLKGNFIVPYGDYELSTSAPFSTLIGVNSDNGSGYYNTKGQTVIALQYRHVGDINCRKIAMVKTQNWSETVIDLKGNVLPQGVITGNFEQRAYRNAYDQPQPDLFRFNNGRNIGFINRVGKTIIAPQYAAASDFTDGMAAVAQQDQFGKVKWGFINTAGTLVIPYNYTNRPGNFHEGLALVAPAEAASFSYAYIDKTGQIKFTVSDGRQFQPFHPADEINRGATMISGGYFNKGYAVWAFGDNDYRLIDASGTVHELGSICKSPDLTGQRLGWDSYNDHSIYFYVYKKGYYTPSHGLMDYQGNVIIPPVFNKVQADYFSSYAVAEISRAGGPNNTAIVTRGIINKDGVFVLTLNQKSVF